VPSWRSSRLKGLIALSAANSNSVFLASDSAGSVCFLTVSRFYWCLNVKNEATCPPRPTAWMPNCSSSPAWSNWDTCPRRLRHSVMFTVKVKGVVRVGGPVESRVRVTAVAGNRALAARKRERGVSQVGVVFGEKSALMTETGAVVEATDVHPLTGRVVVETRVPSAAGARRYGPSLRPPERQPDHHVLTSWGADRERGDEGKRERVGDRRWSSHRRVAVGAGTGTVAKAYCTVVGKRSPVSTPLASLPRWNSRSPVLTSVLVAPW
jgi:hypothetical protein